MRKMLLVIFGLLLFASFASAQTATQTADQIVANYVKSVGGTEKLKAIKTTRSTGKFNIGNGLQASALLENKRPNMVRRDISIQGLTGVYAYDGKNGWKIEPWQGKKDPESLSEEELKDVVESADLDGPLVDYKQKGNKVELVGSEQVEGTDAYKLKVTLKNGDVRYFYLDADRYLPIKMESKTMVRGAEQEAETLFGDYKEVAGVYIPHSVEFGAKGSPNKIKVVLEKIEVNVPVDDSRFTRPAAATKEQPTKTPEDMNVPKTQPNQPNKPMETPTKKPAAQR